MPNTKKTPKTTPKPTKPKKSSVEESLVEDLSNYYAIEFDNDEDKFIKDCVEEGKRRTSDEYDTVKEAKYSEKLGQLRLMWTEFNEKDHPEIRKALKDEDLNVSLAFLDKGWSMSYGGKEDSGGEVNQETILTAARKLVNKKYS